MNNFDTLFCFINGADTRSPVDLPETQNFGSLLPQIGFRVISTSQIMAFISALHAPQILITILASILATLILRTHMIKPAFINSIRLARAILTWRPLQFFGAICLTFKFSETLTDLIKIIGEQRSATTAFEALFLFKYVKVIVHTIAFLLYKPLAIPDHPTISVEDVTVIIPTVGAIDEPEFRETLQTILLNQPYGIVVCTVGEEKLEIAYRVCKEEVAKTSSQNRSKTGVSVMAIQEANKRKQIFAALLGVKTKIVALVDDHVFWGPSYLKASVAPFEDPRIGAVGTNKRVRRDPFTFTYTNFLNFIACNYLERHNFECTASVNVDQAVFVLSGRTAFYRTSILRHPSFAPQYLKETWWFGTVGREGFAVGDDNLLTRFTTGTGQHRVWFQNSEDTIMYTTLGDPHKFFKQMDRWIRTTWRSNFTSLFSEQQVPWRSQPWSVYAIYLSSFVNLAFFYDLALIVTFSLGWDDMRKTLMVLGLRQDHECVISFGTARWLLTLTLFSSKMIKPFPHFWRNPMDVLWIPGYVLFGYYCSFIKLKALLTVNVVHWGTRAGVN